MKGSMVDLVEPCCHTLFLFLVVMRKGRYERALVVTQGFLAILSFFLVLRLALISGREAERNEAFGAHKAKAE